MTTIRRNWKRPATAVAALLLSMAACSVTRAADAPAGPPAVLNEVPADANVVIAITNIKSFSTKLSNAITRLNLPIPAPPDLAGFALRNMGITDGFNQDSSAALVILKPAAQGDNAEANIFAGPPPAVLLLPATDPKAMLQGLNPTAPDSSGISEVTLPGDANDKGYVATVDKNWVALAQDKDVLSQYVAHKNAFSKTAPTETLKTFENNDVVVWTNMSAIGPGLAKSLEDEQQELAGMLDLMNLNNNQDPSAAALQKEVVNQYFALSKEWLKDAETNLFTLRLSDAGATLGSISNFKPDSSFAKFVAAQKPAGPLSLQGLPDGNFLAAGTFSYNGQSVSELMGTVAKQILANEVIAKDPKLPDYQKAISLYQQMAAISSGGSGVLLPAPADSKSGVFNGAMLVDTSDPQKYQSLQLEALKSALVQQSMNPDIKQTVTVTPDAVTIKDVKLTKISISFALREETPDHPISPASKQGVEMLQKMYGGNGMTMYTGIVNQRILSVFGSDQQILEGAVDAASSKSDALTNDASISSVKDQLVPNTVMAVYLPIARWVGVAQSIMKPGTEPQLNGDAGSPMVISAGVNNNTLTIENHIPMSAISATIDAVNKMRSGGTPAQPQQNP